MNDPKNSPEIQAELDALVERFKRDDPDDVIDWPESEMDRRFWDANFWDWVREKAAQEEREKGK